MRIDTVRRRSRSLTRDGAPATAKPAGNPSGRARTGPGCTRDRGTGTDRNCDIVDGRLAEILTERELEVITTLIAGLSNEQIAARLNLGENIVKWHIANILDKTGTADRAQLALRALQRGLNP